MKRGAQYQVATSSAGSLLHQKAAHISSSIMLLCSKSRQAFCLSSTCIEINPSALLPILFSPLPLAAVPSPPFQFLLFLMLSLQALHGCLVLHRIAFSVSRFLYRVAPLSGRHYHLYLRSVTLFALCNGHVMTVGPKTIIYLNDQH